MPTTTTTSCPDAWDAYDDRERVRQQLFRVFEEYVQLPGEGSVSVLVAWTLATHCFELFDAFPLLLFHGMKGAGKSRCLNLLSRLCARPKYLVCATPAAVYTMIEMDRPTLIIDEAQLIRELEPILKVGYSKGAKVPRVDPRTRRVVEFDTYGPKALASTDEFDHIVGDRGIQLTMVRAKTVFPELDRDGFPEAARLLQSKCGQVAKESRAKILESLRDVQDGCSLVGRERQLWTPLLAVARFLGGADVESKVDAQRLGLKRARRAREMEENADVALLVAVEAFVCEGRPLLDRNGAETGWHLAVELLEFVKSRPETRVSRKDQLTRRLRRLGIIPEGSEGHTYKRVETSLRRLAPRCRQEPVYWLDPNVVGELLELYVGM